MTLKLAAILRPQVLVSVDILPLVNVHGRATHISADATRLPIASESQDMVMMIDVIEHIVADEAALAESYRVMVSGGHVVLSVPTPVYPHWFGREFHERIGHVREGYYYCALVSAVKRAGFAPVYARYHTSLPFLVFARIYYTHLMHRPVVRAVANIAARLWAPLDVVVPSPIWGGLVVCASKVPVHPSHTP